MAIEKSLNSLVLLCALAVAGAARGDDTLRCDGRLVRLGDYGFQLEGRCGQPFHVEYWSVLAVAPQFGPAAVARAVQYEDQYFDFGPNRFLVRVRLREDRISQIEPLSAYGRNAPLSECRGARVQPGISVGELVSLCGAPIDRRALPEALVHGDAPVAGVVPARRERWHYPLRDQSRLIVELARGQVVALESTPPLR